MGKKRTIDEEAREAMLEQKDIAQESVATIIETETEIVYQSPQEDDPSPFANLLQQMEESGMLPDPEPEIVPVEQLHPQEEELASYNFPTPEQLDLSTLPEEELPEEEAFPEEEWSEDMLQNLTAEELFPDDMSEEEISEWYRFMAEKGQPTFIQTPDGDEVEVIQETEKERTEREARAQEQPQGKENREEKKAQINIYLNGKRVEEQVFLDHIKEHKALYVAVLREQFPAVKKMIEQDVSRQEILKKAMKKGVDRDERKMNRVIGKAAKSSSKEKAEAVVEVLKQERAQGQSLQTPAEAAARETDIQALIQRAVEKNQDEIIQAQSRLFDKTTGPVSVEVNFTGQDGQVEHNAKLSRNKEGKVYLSLDGKRTSEHELRKVVAEYPGQLKAAVDFKVKMDEQNKETEVIR